MVNKHLSHHAAPANVADQFVGQLVLVASEYLKGHYDYIRVNVPKGEREKIKAYAKSQGMSVNKLLLTALEEYQKAHKQED